MALPEGHSLLDFRVIFSFRVEALYVLTMRMKHLIEGFILKCQILTLKSKHTIFYN